MNELRPWVRRYPRLALASAYFGLPLVFLVAVVAAFLQGLRGFKNAYREEFVIQGPDAKRYLLEAITYFRQEIASRKKE